MSTPNYTQIANEISHIDTTIANLKGRRDELAALILTLMGPGEKMVAGDYEISVRRPAKRLDNRRLTAAFPFSQRPELYKAIIDTTLVREHVAPAELEASDVYATPGTPSVVVK